MVEVMSVFAALESARDKRANVREAAAVAAAGYVRALDGGDAVDVELALRRLRLLVDAMAEADRVVGECYAAVRAVRETGAS